MDNRLLENSMGDVGIDYISDIAVHEAPEGKIYAGLIVTLEATIDTITGEANVGNSLVGAVLPVGAYPFNFRSIQFTIGKAIAVIGTE
jgi:hypothetical protein